MRRRKIYIKNILFIVLGITLLVALSMFIVEGYYEIVETAVYARPSSSGNLHVENAKLCNEDGKLVQLKGVSTHGISYCPYIMQDDYIYSLSKGWNANLFRAAMYSVDYVERDPELNYKALTDAVDMAIKYDMYAIIDWHTLTDNNPNTYSDQAVEFFTKVATKYADKPNVIYEICNEPNQGTTWIDIYHYANKVIPAIKAINPDAVIICGTPNYCQDVDAPSVLPLDEFNNVMYSFHFYAGTHKEQHYKDIVKQSIKKYNLPVFVSEYGLTDNSGNGKLYFEDAADWIDFLNKNKISYAMWSYSDIDESSATFKHGKVNVFNKNDEGLTPAGHWVKDMLDNKNMHHFKAN